MLYFFQNGYNYTCPARNSKLASFGAGNQLTTGAAVELIIDYLLLIIEN